MPKITNSSFKPRPKVTVVPLNFEQPIERPYSPRTSSKTKLQLVSPSLRPSSNLKENHPPQPPNPSKQSKHTSPSRIQLGGKSNNFSETQPNRQISNQSLTDSKNSMVLRHNCDSSRGILPPSTVTISSPSKPIVRPTSPAKISIHFQSRSNYSNYTNPTTGFHLNESMKVVDSKKSIEIAVQATPVVQKSKKLVSIAQFPSDFAIKEQNSLQNLRESYENQMSQIKKLQKEITSNNQEIKNLLQTSKASKGKSDFKDSKKYLVQREQQQIEDIYRGRQPSIWIPQQRDIRQNNNCQTSKKTLINDLKFQSNEKIQKELGGQEIGHNSIGDVSVQTDGQLPIQSQQSNKSSRKAKKLSVMKIQECQIKVLSQSNKNIQKSKLAERQYLKESIINSCEYHQKDIQQKQSLQKNKQESKQLIRSRKSGRISQQKIQYSQYKISKEEIKSVQSISQSSRQFKEKSQYHEEKDCSPVPVSQEILQQPIKSSIKQGNIKQQLPSLSSVGSNSNVKIPLPSPVYVKSSQFESSQPESTKMIQGRKIYNKIYL